MSLKLTELQHLYLTQEPCCSQNGHLLHFHDVSLIKILLLLLLFLLLSAGLTQLKSQAASWRAVFKFPKAWGIFKFASWLTNKADSSGQVCDSYVGENVSNSFEDAKRDARSLVTNPFKFTEHIQTSGCRMLDHLLLTPSSSLSILKHPDARSLATNPFKFTEHTQTSGCAITCY